MTIDQHDAEAGNAPSHWARGLRGKCPFSSSCVPLNCAGRSDSRQKPCAEQASTALARGCVPRKSCERCTMRSRSARADSNLSLLLLLLLSFLLLLPLQLLLLTSNWRKASRARSLVRMASSLCALLRGGVG